MMCDEPYMVICLGNAYDFVIKNVNEPETYGTFQGDRKSITEFIEKVNSIVKENGQLKKDCTALVCSNQDYRKENEQLKKQIKIFDEFLNGNNLDIDWNELCILDSCIMNDEIECRDCIYMGMDVLE